jgi:translation initiation factor IF-2
MAETNDDSSKKTLSLNRPGRLELKTTVDGGQVRQSFPHGRGKQVAVEVKKKRVIRPGRGEETPAAEAPAEQPAPAPAQEARPEAAAKARPKSKEETRHAEAREASARVDTPQEARAPIVLKNLTAEEREGRIRALEESKKAEEAARRKAEQEAIERAAEEKRLKAEREESERRNKDEEARRQREEEARLRGEEQAQRLVEKQRVDEPLDDGPVIVPGGAGSRGAAAPEEDADKRGGKPSRRSPLAPRVRQADNRRRSGKLTVSQALSAEEEEGRSRSLAAARRAREKLRQQQMGQNQAGGPKKIVRDVVVPEAITVQELANRMAVRGGEVIKKLMQMGQMVTITQTIDADTAELLVEEFGHNVRRVSAADVEHGLKQDDDADALKRPRPPVVTVMGHVDHGKTSLLDALRKTDVVGGEAGGITQHIGAYQVQLGDGSRITFLDTPGHAAFTAMRARGAGVTDIVVLVVAADDSVMPQTREAIDHAKAAGVPIIVAINKSDLPAANPDKVRQDLLRHELVVEGMGGDVLDVEVSAIKGTGLDKLEESILLQAEVLDLKANPDRDGEGVVIESRLDKGRGVVATLLVQRGTLETGDIIVVGKEWGRIRAMQDDHGRAIKSAGPSVPVEVLGLSGAPQSGDEFSVVENEKRAREISAYREETERQDKITSVGRASVEQLFANIAAGQIKELPVVIKADVHGSVEAIAHSLEEMGTDEVKPRVLHSAVGGVTESDVTLAKASDAIILGFGVRPNSQARQMADKEGVEIRYYKIIYELLDEVKAMLSGLLSPTTEERVLGAAQVLETFDISKIGTIAGCRVMDGVVKGSGKIRLLRDGRVLFDGNIKSLRHHKDEVREIKQGSECGIQLDGWQDIKIGDEIEFYELAEVARTL